MDAAPIFTEQPQLAARHSARPLWVALAITALLTALRLIDTVDSDVAWQLWIAGRVHAGAVLYRDIIEVNPPLWFWMALPVDRIAAIFHLRIDAVLVALMGGIAALSLAAMNRLLPDIESRQRGLLLSFAALVLMAMPWTHVGQREQIVLIGAAPYAALIAARLEGRRVSLALAAAIGVGAALGFALKHYFLVVPVLLELWLLVGRRDRWRPVRPETVALVAVGISYAAAIVLLAPEWLTDMVPLIRLAYGATGAPALHYLFGPFALAGLAALGLGLSQYKRLENAPLAAALLVAAIGFAAAYFIQAKGWPYHAIPMLGCAMLALAVLLAGPEGPLRLFAPALLALPLFLAAEDRFHPALPSPDLLGAVAGLDRGDTVAFLSTEPALAWSVTLQQGYRYPSRYMGYWMMNAIIRNEALGGPNPRLTALGRQVVTDTVDDFRCLPPRRIIVWRPRPGQHAFDILPFFQRDPRFTALLSHYRATSRTSLETYEQISPLPPPVSPCHAGV